MTEPGNDARVIAIDGPSGTGKSSVARKVACRLGAGYLDTGAMYRALTLAVLSDGLDPADAEKVAARAEGLVIDITTDPENHKVFADGRDVTMAIRSAEVSAAVSAVSAVSAVRRRLVHVQRQLAGGATIVVEGRDIGTVVFPAAALKIYLTATPSARATRRAEQVGISEPGEIAALADSLRRRDDFDSTRAVSPLRPASDAVVLDSTDMSEEDVVEAVLAAATSRNVGASW
ncbi:MAG: (d)CMP kinase [Geodermatophilaceae bacterium]|nr:(d)CMP kinase [Geodermatophilaceae bacterium]